VLTYRSQALLKAFTKVCENPTQTGGGSAKKPAAHKPAAYKP